MSDKQRDSWQQLGDVLEEMFQGPLLGQHWLYPPYDSPLERLFAHHLVKYVHDEADLRKQVPISTICGTFRLDFVLQRGIKRVVFECDGRDFHDPIRDEWRDGMILGAEAVDVIYRFRGSDLTYHLNDCLFVISRWEPDIFSPRGLLQLEALASDEVRNYVENVQPEQHTWHQITYHKQPESKYSDPLFISITRNSRHDPLELHIAWRNKFNFAKSRGGGTLDEVMAEWYEPSVG